MKRIATVVFLCQGAFESANSWTISPWPSLVALRGARTTFYTSSRTNTLGSTTASIMPHRRPGSKGAALYDTSIRSDISAVTLPRLEAKHLQFLNDNRYVVVPNFLPEPIQQALRDDVQTLRLQSKFNIARIGQDSTNTLNTNIRVAETCFIGPGKLATVPSSAREELYSILDTVRRDLEGKTIRAVSTLDPTLTELLYAYYPQGGFYRRHRDAVPGSASTLRKISLLLYLNKDWDGSTQGGHLRLHFDAGGDELPAGDAPNFKDVEPHGGTLVLFESDALPHEVLDTVGRDHLAVVGWYNRPVQLSDAVELGAGDLSPMRLVLAAVGLGLVTFGVLSLS